MRLFLFLAITIFFYQPFANADNIEEFEIDGISIGDSALNFFSEEKIVQSILQTSYSSDEYYDVEIPSDGGTYEIYGFAFKKSDKNYLIYSIKGMDFINFEKCLKKKNNVTNDIRKILSNDVDEKNYRSNFRNKFGKSYAEITDFNIEGGSIRIWCDNFDKNFEASKLWDDALHIDITSNKYLNWLNTKAY